MDRQQLIGRLAETDEDKILLARVYERMQTAEQRNMPASTAFLSKREQILVQRLLPGMELHFWGGFPEAERAACCYVPDYYMPEEWLSGEDGPVCALHADYYAGDTLTHRDVLGALMGSGIKRETVGDILMQQAGAFDFLVTREILPYVLQNLESAGRTKLHLSRIPLDALKAPAAEKKEIRDTVAALRLDSIVASGFGLSRAKAAVCVESGRTSVNWLPCEKPDRQVAQGDQISVRGMGKIELTSVGGTTKKGRIGVIISRYV